MLVRMNRMLIWGCDMATKRKPKTRADYAIWRARSYLDWMQAAFDGAGDYPVEWVAGLIGDEVRILLTEARQQRKDGQDDTEAGRNDRGAGV